MRFLRQLSPNGQHLRKERILRTIAKNHVGLGHALGFGPLPRETRSHLRLRRHGLTELPCTRLRPANAQGFGGFHSECDIACGVASRFEQNGGFPNDQRVWGRGLEPAENARPTAGWTCASSQASSSGLEKTTSANASRSTSTMRPSSSNLAMHGPQRRVACCKVVSVWYSRLAAESASQRSGAQGRKHPGDHAFPAAMPPVTPTTTGREACSGER